MTKILSVSQLTEEIKRQLEGNLGTVTVRGEVINLKTQASGHSYFTLKDAGSQIAAVLFKGASRGLTKLPKEGDQIVVQGQITVYSPRGSYQILVRSLQYQGVGDLLAKLHERKKQLQELGYFDIQRKKKLPLFPKTIGVITSPTGAVIQDILQILQRRHSGFHLILSPVKVQGEGAKEEIAKAIKEFNEHKLADVLIVGRGGGSLEDLWAFNEDAVVQAVYNSEIPIVSAVGHETDFSLCDFVADVRAPTPSAAAELVIAEKEQQFKFLLQCKRQIGRQGISLLLKLRSQLQSKQQNPYISSPYLLLSKSFQGLDEMKLRLTTAGNSLLKGKRAELLSLEKQKNLLEPSYQIKLWKEKFSTAQKLVERSLIQRIKAQKENLNRVVSHLKSIDPKNLLTKGYCILFSENKESVILSTSEIATKQNLKIQLHDGQVKVKVEEII
jgi:exodeoxyribonuclease VII large subunit